MTVSDAGIIGTASLKAIGNTPIVCKLPLQRPPIVKASNAPDGLRLVSVLVKLNPYTVAMADFYCPADLARELPEWHYNAMTFTFEHRPEGNRFSHIAFGEHEFEVINK